MSGALSIGFISQYSTPRNRNNQTNPTNEALRKAYLQIFADQVQLHLNNPNWWKDQFIESAEILSTAVRSDFKEASSLDNKNNSEADEVSFACNNKIYTADAKHVLLVGRHQGCDISLSSFNDQNVSRVHGIIYIFREHKKLIVIDVGSALGIITEQRSSETQLMHSLPDNRKILIFELYEYAVLKMGSTSLTIQPKECIICFERPRSIRFASTLLNGTREGCEHYVVCRQCVMRINKCPICQATIINQSTNINITENNTQPRQR